MNPDQQQGNRDQPEDQQTLGQESGAQQNTQTVPPPQLASPAQQQNEPSTGAAGQALVTDPKTRAVSKGVHVPLEVQEGGTSTSSGPAPVTDTTTGIASKPQTVSQPETLAEATKPSTGAISKVAETKPEPEVDTQQRSPSPPVPSTSQPPASSSSSSSTLDENWEKFEKWRQKRAEKERRAAQPGTLRRIRKGTSRLLFGPSQSSGAEAAHPPSALQQFMRRALGKRDRPPPTQQSIEATPDDVASEEQRRQQQLEEEAQQYSQWLSRHLRHQQQRRATGHYPHVRYDPSLDGWVSRSSSSSSSDEDEVVPSYGYETAREAKEEEMRRRQRELLSQRTDRRFRSPPNLLYIKSNLFAGPRPSTSAQPQQGESQEKKEEKVPDFHELFPETTSQEQPESGAQAQRDQTPPDDDDLIRRLGLDLDELRFIDDEDDDGDESTRR